MNKKAVRIQWADNSGLGGDCTLDYQADTTADAICMAIDDLEASGVDLASCASFAIVAKAGAGADAMLSCGFERRAALC